MMQSSPSPDELVHYGVKGMKWGVRKSEPTNSEYSTNQQNYDKKNYGKSGVKRINSRMNKGATLTAARRQEGSRRGKIRTAVVLGAFFAPEIASGAHFTKNIIKLSAGVLSQKVAVKAETNRGRAAAAEAMGLPRQASSGPSYAKKSRDGAYKVSSF